MLDASVPESVAEVFEASGHFVIRHADVLFDGTPDITVCETAIANEAILVAVDADFQHLTRRFKQTDQRYKRLSLVYVGCDAVMSSKRVEQALSVIAHEWEISCRKQASRLWFEVANHRLTTYR